MKLHDFFLFALTDQYLHPYSGEKWCKVGL
jgi:hypothetical protein